MKSLQFSEQYDRKEEDMKVLIIGAAGFAGWYLAAHLKQEYGWEVSVTKLKQESFLMEDVTVYDLDLRNPEEISELLEQLQPEVIFHLAAQSSVALSWSQPDLTVDVNIQGCIHLLETIRKLNINPRVLLIGSGEEYGYIAPEESPVSEQNPLRPGNLYAVTKLCQTMIGKIYANAYQMPILMVRAFNHIGPRQSPAFVVSDFCRQVAEIEQGKKEPVLSVGNLSAKRDFTDVRDIVRAYGLLVQKGKAGETYNVGSGHAIEIEKLLEMIIAFSNTKIKVQADPQKLRPLDIPVIEANIEKLVQETGWQPQIPLSITLQETLEYWREQIRAKGIEVCGCNHRL